LDCREEKTMKINLKIVKLVAVVFMMALTAVLMMSCGGGRWKRRWRASYIHVNL